MKTIKLLEQTQAGLQVYGLPSFERGDGFTGAQGPGIPFDVVGRIQF